MVSPLNGHHTHQFGIGIDIKIFVHLHFLTDCVYSIIFFVFVYEKLISPFSLKEIHHSKNSIKLPISFKSNCLKFSKANFEGVSMGAVALTIGGAVPVPDFWPLSPLSGSTSFGLSLFGRSAPRFTPPAQWFWHSLKPVFNWIAYFWKISRYPVFLISPTLVPDDTLYRYRECITAAFQIATSIIVCSHVPSLAMCQPQSVWCFEKNKGFPQCRILHHNVKSDYL